MLHPLAVMFLTVKCELRETQIENHPKNTPVKFHWNQTDSARKSFKVWAISIWGKNALPTGSHVCQWINMSWRNLLESHSKNIPTKFHWRPLSSFLGEDFYSFLLPQQSEFCIDSKFLKEFYDMVLRWCVLRHFSKSAQWFHMRCLSETVAGRQTSGDHKSSPWALCAQVSQKGITMNYSIYYSSRHFSKYMKIYVVSTH